MEFRRITDHIPKEIADLYNESFTVAEKVPLKNIERTFTRGGELLRFESDGKFIGFTFSYSNNGPRLFVYFATIPNLRCKGYGKTILRKFTELHSEEDIFLIVEPLDENAEDLEIRKRRKEYYKRNNFVDAGYRVISDNYPFDVMIANGNVDKETAVRTVKEYEDVHNGLL